jgi:hypothetical protein
VLRGQLDDAIYALLVPSALKKVCGELPPLSCTRFLKDSVRDGCFCFKELSEEERAAQREAERRRHFAALLHPFVHVAVRVLVLVLDVALYLGWWCSGAEVDGR